MFISAQGGSSIGLAYDPAREVGTKDAALLPSGSGAASFYSGASTETEDLGFIGPARFGGAQDERQRTARSLAKTDEKVKTVCGTSLAQTLEIEGLLASVRMCLVPFTVLPARDQEILLARLDALNGEADALQEQVDEQVRVVRELLGKAETVGELTN